MLVSAAFRADLEGHGRPFGPDDQSWVAVATIVEHAQLAREPARGALLRDAVELAHDVIGEHEVVRLANREWGDKERTPIEALLLLADRIHYAGAHHLASALLDALATADTSLTIVQRARILARRARIDWKTGNIDDATDRCHYLEDIGRQAESDEIRARASIGFIVLSQMRGNYPEMRQHARRAARFAARSGLKRLMREAHSGLLITAGVAKRLNEALLHGWTVYELSVGDPIDEAEILQNLGQALLDSGFSDTARAVFAALVARELPVRIMLPALGGLALASAASGHHATTEWAADEVERVDRLLAPNYALASALVECAVALSRIGRDGASERCRQAAMKLALAENYYEVAYRAEDLDRSNLARAGAPSPALTKRAARIARELEWMEPPRLPMHVALATVPA